MSDSTTMKLLPRNAAALRRGQDLDQEQKAAIRLQAGNPVSTRLESGVGNCFPGLEFDIRNLERRFFPFLEVEFGADNNGPLMRVASVNTDGVRAAAASGALTNALSASYLRIAADLAQNRTWRITQIAGNFGPLKQLTVTVANMNGESFGTGRLPPDAWTAARLLVEDSPITLTLTRTPAPGQVTLTGNRARYLDANGALARIFEPGELTQSLCSPWTHDFRDCACYYWASNHPDIALPPKPAGLPASSDNRFNLDTPWERADRSMTTPPIAVTPPKPAIPEMQHNQINRDWQSLNFVLERRERLTDYAAAPFTATPLANRAALIQQLRYAAGVELGVMQEYLTAAWSLRPFATVTAAAQDDVRAAFAEILQIAIGEMRHLRAVNGVLAGLTPRPAFVPALAVTNQLPGTSPATPRPLQFRAAEPAVIDEFIDLEAPAASVDTLYGRILATLEAGEGNDEQQQAISTVIAEGESHWETFKFIKEWLGRHPTSVYLRGAALQPPPAANPAHITLQQRYRSLLETLDAGYRAGIPAGASNINAARSAMLGAGGIQGAMDAVAAQGFLVVFDPIADARFAAIPQP